MLFQESPIPLQISDYFLWRCQATMKDNKLTMAFFFMKIISPSKPSVSIAKNMQCLQALDLTSSATNKKTSYNPGDAYSMLGTVKFALLSYSVGLISHNFHSKFDVLKMAFVPHCNVTQTGLTLSVTRSQCFFSVSLCQTSCRPLCLTCLGPSI